MAMKFYFAVEFNPGTLAQWQQSLRTPTRRPTYDIDLLIDLYSATTKIFPSALHKTMQAFHLNINSDNIKSRLTIVIHGKQCRQ